MSHTLGRPRGSGLPKYVLHLDIDAMHLEKYKFVIWNLHTLNIRATPVFLAEMENG